MRMMLRDCCKGASIIEFAIVAPVFMLLLVGFIELGLIFFTSTILESATGISSRIGKTGFAPAGVNREEFIRSELRRLSGGYLSPDLLQIDVVSYKSFASIGQPEPCTTAGDPPPCVNGFDDVNGNGQWDADQGAAGVGTRGKVALYRVNYPWSIFTPLMRQVIGNSNGIYNISAIATVKNENF